MRCPPAAAPPPHDDREGAFLLFEPPLLHPIERTRDGKQLWVVNPAAATVAVFDLSNPLLPRLVDEVPVGLGPVAVVERPRADALDTPEIWVVCADSNSVFVLDREKRRLVTSIPLPHGPSGLAFAAEGSTAFVTLATSNQIARIDARTRRVVERREFAAAFGAELVHGVEPRALVVSGQELFALSAKSGNGTALDVNDVDGDGLLFEVLDTWRALASGRTGPPPDRDVFRFPIAPIPAEASTPTGGQAALWRMGTLGNDLAIGPDGEIWVANVDLSNERYAGKFAHRRNDFTHHRVSHAKPSLDGSPQGRTAHLDLNRDRDRALPADYACAAPTALAFTADHSRLFVACGETRNVAVVDPAAGLVVGELRVDLSSSRGWGPRGLALNEEAGIVYVYHRDQTLSVFRVGLGSESIVKPLTDPTGSPIAAGFDPTPEPIRAGRRLFTDARRSRSRTVSCNTCHPDARADGLAWDLRDFTGDLPRAAVPRDENTIRVTQDLRAAAMTPPYHWRGDRRDLADFEPAFEALLDGPRLSRQEMAELEAYIFSLALPPNPSQDLHRRLSPLAQRGWDCFGTVPSHAVSKLVSGLPTHGSLAEGRLSVTCLDCHAMDGGLATNNQLINEVRFPVPQDTTHLLGLSDKLRDEVEYAGARRPVTGWGFGSTGMFATIFDFIGMFPDVGLPERRAITAFVEEMDSGLSPAAAVAATIDSMATKAVAEESVGDPQNTEALALIKDVLLPASRAGDAELIVRGWWRDPDAEGLGVASERRVAFLYDAANERFVGDSATAPSLTFEQLLAHLNQTSGVLAFLGVPRGLGRRLALDRDHDFLGDGDEFRYGTRSDDSDSDRDGFADGLEVAFAANPSDPESRPRPTPAQISGAEIVWIASTVAKVRWKSSREERYRLRVLTSHGAEPQAAPLAEVWSGEELAAERVHSQIVRGLETDRVYQIAIEPARAPNSSPESPSVDERGATNDRAVLSFRTQPPLFRSVHVARTIAALTEAAPSGHARITARFRIEDESGRPVDRAVVHGKAFEWLPAATSATSAPSAATAVRTFATAPSVDGWAEITIESHFAAGSGAHVEVAVDTAFDRGIEEPEGRLSFHPMSHEFGAWAEVTLR